MRLAQSSDLSQMTEILDRCFQSDAHIAWFIRAGKNEKNNQIRRKVLMRLLCEQALSCGLAYVSDNGQGVGLWQRYNAKPKGLSYLRANLAYLFTCGLKASLKSLAMENEVQKRFPRGDYLFLWTLGIAEEYRGQGIFKELVDPLLNEARGKNIPVYLETTVEKNIAIYEHYGFEVIDTYRFQDSPQITFMALKA